MDRLTVQDPVLLVLAAGETPSAVNNARGHLFEKFIANLLHEYGYDAPNEADLNVTSDGIEIDVTATHSLSGHTAIVEGKAYTNPLSARVVTSFYGMLSLYRHEHPDAHGYIFVTPRLVAQGEEQAKKASAQDPKFHYLNSVEIAERLRVRGILSEPDLTGVLTSDPAIIVSEEGVYGAIKVLDEVSRTARAVVVWAKGNRHVPHPVLDLLAEHDYSSGVDVQDLNSSGSSQSGSTFNDEPPLVVQVQASKSDFDALPASPENFVGRQPYLSSLQRIVAPGSGVFVLNSQSGWGKSSLALQAKRLVESVGGYASILDSRTASSPRYVTEVLKQSALAAEQSKLIKLRSNQSWASLSSAWTSIEEAEWLRSAPMLVFFDQFENVFLQEGTTREFRDLALRIVNTKISVLVGFAWKTDLVSWVEGHPYHFRDEIRGAGEQLMVGPMPPGDIDTFLGRLGEQLPDGLTLDLAQRLREYSKGLPWLFKKLAEHVIKEIRDGKTQEQLASEALNVTSLFEADMAGLSPIETETLKYIARLAPVSATEVTERYDASLVQSLLDRRLVVAIGDQLDTYWDIFRDFLNTDGFAFTYSSSTATASSTVTGASLGGSIVYDDSGSIVYSSNLNSSVNYSIPMQYYNVVSGNQAIMFPTNLVPLDKAPPAYRRFAARAKSIASSESATLSIVGYDQKDNVLILNTGNWPLSLGTIKKIAEAALSLGVSYRLQA